MKAKALVLYLPVFHQGYFDFLNKYKDHELYILGEELIEEFMPLHTEIRALKPAEAKKMVDTIGFPKVEILTPEITRDLKERKIVLPNEEISKKFAEKYLLNSLIEFENIFLRWDERSVYSKSDVNYDRISTDKFDREMIARAGEKCADSSCWWRQVGAVLVKDGKIVFNENNQHVPYQQMNYINGDPRDFIQAGKDTDIASALHSEQLVITKAAKDGVSLNGADLYVTVYPCPICAKLIAYSGIKRVFFSSGHASLDGETVLKANGVELIKVEAK